MKTYVITLAKEFPTKHPRKGQPTNFGASVLEAVWRAHNMTVHANGKDMKLHTIRENCAIWEKRFEKIYAGKACISIRQWMGKPYHSAQQEICKLKREDGINLQKIYLKEMRSGAFDVPEATFAVVGTDEEIPGYRLAANDGLTFADWLPFFRKHNFMEPLAVINFTRYQY